MIAVMALAFTACKKNDTGSKTLVFKGTTEQMIVVDQDPGAKVYLDTKNKIKFAPNDLITIIHIEDTTDGSGVTTASNFLVDASKNWGQQGGNIDWDNSDDPNGGYFAYYPGGAEYANLDSLNPNDPIYKNRVTFTLAGAQNYEANADGTPQVPKNAFYIAAKVGGVNNLDEANFKFKSICGILGLRLYSTQGETIKEIKVVDNAYNITGKVSMKIHEVDPDYMTYLFRNYDWNNPTYVTKLTNYMERIGYYVEPGSSKSVRLVCGGASGVTVANNANQAKEFYIVMRPLALSKGGRLEITLGSGRVAYIENMFQHCITPNTITRITPINVDEY
jgi:hypothetical protein